MHILVVDDQKSVRSMVRSELRQLGLENVTEAEDGLDALGKLKVGRVDLVITDVTMPRLDGIGLLRAMRAEPRCARTPVVFLTGAAVGELISEAAKLGVAGVIAKPFSIGTFGKRLSVILAKHAERTAKAAPPVSPPPPDANVLEID